MLSFFVDDVGRGVWVDIDPRCKERKSGGAWNSPAGGLYSIPTRLHERGGWRGKAAGIPLFVL